MNRCLHKYSSYRWNRLLGAFVLCLMIAVSGGMASAKEPGPVISVVVNGRGVQSDVSPIHRNGRMLVPIRVVAEATGSEVSYEAATQKVFLNKKGKHITLTIGSQTAYVDGKRWKTDVSPIIVNRRTLVPIRFISEAFGYQVQWDKKSAVAYIQSKPVEDKAASVKYSLNPYVVQQGDTLSKISARHDTNMSAIQKNNHLSSDELLVGQILFLPEGAQRAEYPIATKVADDQLTGNQFRFPFHENSWYEPYGDSFGSDREWTESNSGSVRSHEGIDIMAPKGTPIYSVSDGTINKVGWNTYGGWRVNITDENGQYRMYYAHLQAYAPGLHVGKKIKAGQLIGFVGDTGYGGTGTVGMFEPHLHFGLYRNSTGKAIDPYDYLRIWEQNKVESPL
ncbi:murein DD-endopeptidase MepM/ murein hydrolase activator NlpD [Brevibacillus sp. AG162]|uniref:stalk domain-containing protein n=1 Tax=Brevibacillus sp. AG162 TaxID=2572910 RepID=UPI00114E775E|nr:stalk domain-containing protein [Brevibacillus sp. AG162]TQK75102.1 murein DD-endopeptidase MepM/ murein hydrolase activator NlpD [Brevibacillus sp. AG162]